MIWERIYQLMDGPFIRTGSKSTVNERAAVYSKDAQCTMKDQSGLLIYLLLS